MQARIESLERQPGGGPATGAFAGAQGAGGGLTAEEAAELLRSFGPAPSLEASGNRRRSAAASASGEDPRASLGPAGETSGSPPWEMMIERALVPMAEALAASTSRGRRNDEETDEVTKLLLGRGSSWERELNLGGNKGGTAQMVLRNELREKPERQVAIFRRLMEEHCGRLDLRTYCRTYVPLKGNKAAANQLEFLMDLWELLDAGMKEQALAEVGLQIGAIQQMALDGDWEFAREAIGKAGAPLYLYPSKSESAERGVVGDATLLDPRRIEVAKEVCRGRASTTKVKEENRKAGQK